MTDKNETEALRKTWDHINLVMKLLGSAQIELMRRQFTHDRSKLVDPEWQMFESITHELECLTYGSPEYEAQRQKMLGQALQHHYFHNRHHPEFFEDRGILGMNLFDLLEMLCDWIAACQRHADGDIARSIEINRDRFGLSDDLVQILKNTVPWILDEFSSLTTQRDIGYERGLEATHIDGASLDDLA